LRSVPAPGSHYVKIGQPGFRWNVLDYGTDNVLATPLRTSHRCDGIRAAWHCLWQRFPHQTVPPAPPKSSALGHLADELYNISLAGRHPRLMLQYLIIGAVSQVLTTPTVQLRRYMTEHLKTLCHVGGPYCSGTPEQMRTPVAAVHVRHGDSCDRVRSEAGPFNAMFAWDEKKNRLDRVGFRWCYTLDVYVAELRKMQQKYGVRTVLLATDNADGKVLRALKDLTDFNWVYFDYPRAQFKKKGWMEFRRDVDEHVPFSIAAAVELLSHADMLVGNMGSHVSRIIYDKMVVSSATSVLPPFISVDGYGMCCDFTEECSREQIKKRERPIRDCIYWYGKCTGGDQWFYHRG